MKHLNPFESKKHQILTYDEALKISEFDEKIKQIINVNYPEHGVGAYQNSVIGAYQNSANRYVTSGKSLSVTQTKKILALAKRNNDVKLLELLDKKAKNLKEVERNREINKYNI